MTIMTPFTRAGDVAALQEMEVVAIKYDFI